MKMKQLNVRTPSLEELARKYKLDVSVLQKQLEKGIEVEKEHTTDDAVAREIALDHLGEVPDYYDKLEKVEKK